MVSRNNRLRVLLSGWLISGLTATGCFAQDLLVFPKRIVFDGTKRKTEIINLTNSGKDSAVYEVSFVEIRMREDGSFENITQPDEGQLFASAHLKYFPRKVTLAPGESQTVKLQLAPAGNMAAGEYRSHLYFRSVPKSIPTSMESATASADDPAITIKLTPVYGITIPAIVRVGVQSGKAVIAGAAFDLAQATVPLLTLDFKRSGSTSVYGDIHVYHTSPGGKPVRVGEVSGFAVYTPTTSRTAKIALNSVSDVNYSQGKFTITYLASGKKEILAQTELLLP